MTGALSSWRQNNALVQLLTVFAASFASVMLVYKVMARDGGFVYVWPLTGVQLVFLLPIWSRSQNRARAQLAGSLGTFVACRLVGLPVWFALAVTLCSTVDVAIAGRILSERIRGFEDLKRGENLTYFGCAAIAAPILSSLLNAFPLAAFLHEGLIRAFLLSALCDSLGIAVFMPFGLYLLTGENRRLSDHRRELKTAVPVALLFVIVAIAVFWQTRYPLMFTVFPPMVLLLLCAGLEGAVFVSITLSFIAGVATRMGHGPLWLMHVPSLDYRVILLQGFLWMSIGAALPVGALLAEQRRVKRELNASHQRFEAFMDRSPMAAFIKDADGRMCYYNRSLADLFNIDRKQWLGKTDHQLWPQDRADAFRNADLAVLAQDRDVELEEMTPQPDGGCIFWRSYKFPFVDGDGQRYLAGVAMNVTREKLFEEELKESEAKLRKAVEELELLTLTDPLTGVGNRRYFDKILEQSLADAQCGQNAMTMLLLDIDHFKRLNDSFGHKYGDEVLSQVGAELQLLVRSTDHVCRYGGEEFAIILPDTTQLRAKEIADRICAEFRQKNWGLCSVTVSIGIAQSGQWVKNGLELTALADAALYKAKANGRDRAILAHASVLAASGSV